MTKVTFLIECQAKNLIKMDKHPSKWSWFYEIGYIEWIGFSQIDPINLTLNQINHYDLIFNQMNHIHLMT